MCSTVDVFIGLLSINIEMLLKREKDDDEYDFCLYFTKDVYDWLIANTPSIRIFDWKMY